MISDQLLILIRTHIQGIFLFNIRSLTHSASATWDNYTLRSNNEWDKKETGKANNQVIQLIITSNADQLNFHLMLQKEKYEICRFSITPKRERDEP